MDPWLTDRTRLILLLSFCALLASIEALIPLFHYRRGRLRRALPNLVLAAGVVLVNLALASVTALVSAWVTRHRVGLLAGLGSHAVASHDVGSQAIASHPWGSHPWVLLAAGVAGLDLFAYLAHLLLHKIPAGWQFHRVHHSELEVDVTTAFRQHPGETLWRAFWQCLGTAVLGLPFWVIPLYLSLSSLNALLEHANLRVSDRFDRWLRLLVVTPNMHKVHHSRLLEETDSNYSNIFSLWDRLCGTYTARSNCHDLRYGLDGFDDERRQTLASLLTAPFRAS